jgi:glycosyltransferase involved in cell wall biosynthesis
MRQKIIHVVEDLRTGGVEIVLRNLVLHLDHHLFNMEVWCLARGGEIADQLRAAGIPVRIFGMTASPSFAWIYGLARRVRESGAAILHCHSYTACAVGRSAGILARTPVLLAHVHTLPIWLTARQRWKERILACWTHKIICVSNAVADFVAREEGIPRTKMEVIYNGVPDLDLPEPLSARRSLGLSPDSNVLGCIAMLRPEKGHDILLRAAAQAASRIPKLELLLVGDGPRRSELEAEARQLPVRCVLAGQMADVRAALAAVDAVALLSPDREGLSVALVEACAASRPVIATRIGGIPEIVSDDVNGFLCEPGNVADAADRIARLFQDSARMRQMGEAARQTYLAKFQLPAMVARIERLYGR